MKKVFIKEKLAEIDFPIESISLGEFDYIGEYTAKKNRTPDKELFRSVGCFFRPNYERGILLYALVSKFDISSFLEIGFGRGYSAFCVAKAMTDLGIDGKITTVDPNMNEEFLNSLTQVFPKEWFDKINFVKGTSQEMLPKLDDKFDLIYIDGDHTHDAVKSDWEMTKEKYNKFLLFDDYHLPTKDSGPGIQCAQVIDQIDDDTKELIVMDRRIFFDDRRISDDDIDYGQVLLRNKNLNLDDYILDW